MSSNKRIALALNNIGVTLMQKGSWESAIVTMADSLLLIIESFCGASNSNKIDSEAMYHRAMARYTESQQKFQVLHTEVHVVEEEDFEAVRAAANYGPSLSVAFPVRISGFTQNTRHINAEDAKNYLTILHNLGLAYFLASKRRQDGETNNYLRYALEKLHMAEVLSEDILSSELEMEDNDEVSIILTSAMVLNCLSAVYNRLGSYDQSVEALRMGAILCSEVEDDCFSDVLTEPQIAAAA